MDEPLDMNKLGKGRKGPWNKQLDCEGIDISAEKGKINIIELEKLSLYTKDQIKKYGEKKYQEYKDSLSKDDKEYLENKYGKMK